MEVDEEDLMLVEDDCIEAFLKQKLKSIESMNEHLEATLAEVQGNCAQFQSARGHFPTAPWRQGLSWTKVHNGKWCFIVELLPDGERSTIFKDFELALQWTPIITPQYEMKLYADKAFRNEVASKDMLHIIITIEDITFASHRQFQATCVLYCRTKDADGKMKLSLPSLSLDVEALNNGSLSIQSLNLINNNQADILCVLACCREIQLCISLPTHTVTRFKDYLIIDCMCRELNLNGVAYYLFTANANHLNGCILKPDTVEGIEGTQLISFFVQDVEQLYTLIHYLKTTIPGVQLQPFRNFSHAQGEDVKKFAECLLQQIDSVINFQQNVAANRELQPECDVTEEYDAMRSKLTEIEFAADLLHAKLT